MSAESATESWFSFHDVPVCLAYPALEGDPLRPLLAGFDARASTEAGVRIELSPHAAPVDVLASEWQPTFCHGRAQGYTQGRRHRLSDGRMLLELDPERGSLRGYVGDESVGELGNGMLHVALCLMLREHGLFDAHAAVATFEGDAFMIAGDSGAGKTTTLLALLSAGAQYLGDDRVLLRRAASGVELLGYPRDFRLTPATLRAYPGLRPEVSAWGLDGKLRVDPKQVFGSKFRPSASERLCLLSVALAGDATTSVRPLGAADAMGALMSASATVALEVLPRRDEQLEVLTQLANRARAFEVRLGRDLLEQPVAAGARLLNQLREAG